MAIAGKVAITPGGEWSESTAYDKLVVVTYNNDLYLSKKANTGVSPTDEETWQLLIKNVTQEQYDNILNGTTAVGNALKLNGLTADEFVKGQGKSFASGETVLSWAISPNGVYKKFAVEANGFPSDAPIKAEGYYELSIDGSGNRRQVKFTPFRADVLGSYTRTIYSNSWYTEWTNDADGGNADTVDGLHASDFVKTTGGTINGNLSLFGNGVKQLSVGHIIDGVNYDTRLWTGVDKRAVVTLHENGQEISAFYFDKEVLRYSNGTTANDILHTGNSQKVVTSASAPSDTSAVWIDSANKVSKIYIDGAWTALA